MPSTQIYTYNILKLPPPPIHPFPPKPHNIDQGEYNLQQFLILSVKSSGMII